MTADIMKELREKMQQAVQAYTKNLATVRTGRANPSILDSIFVDYYGTSTPLNQLANVAAPEVSLLVITPFDKTAIDSIEKAIQQADIGLTPSNDGDLIRINIPSLTEERREELAKVVGRYTEESRIQIRNNRREANDQLRALEKEGDLTEDELRSSQDEVQKETDQYTTKIEQLAEQKEKEIMEV